MQDFSAVYEQTARSFVEFSGDVSARLLQQGANLLEDMSRKATRPAERERYHGDAQVLLSVRDALRGQFAARLEDKFSRFRAGEELSEQETLGAQPEELSREVVRTVDCLTNQVAEPLWHLNMRMALLRGGLKTVDYSNPLGPAQVCGALCAVLARQGVQPRTQLLLFRLVEKHLPERLAAFYEALNGKLAAAGVFPHLRYYLVETGRGQDTGQPGAFGRDAQQSALEHEREVQVHLAAMLREQAQYRDTALRRTALGSSFGRMDTEGRGGADTLTETDIAFVIIAVQTRFPVPRGRVYRPTPPVADIEALVIDQLYKAGGHSGRSRLKRPMAEGLSRMGLLFSWLVQDRFLGRELRDLLSHLYLPFLKVGMLEGRFWTDPSHPGRRLLGLLCELAEFWVATADNDRTVYPQLHAAAERLTRDYIDDISVVAEVADELEAFAQRIGQRAVLTLNRTVESERGMARVGSAQAFAASEAASVLADGRVPAVVRETLQEPLAEFLAGLVLRGHDRSDGVAAVADAVLQAVGEPGQAAAGRAGRLAVLAGRLGALNSHAAAVQGLVTALDRALERWQGLEGMAGDAGKAAKVAAAAPGSAGGAGPLAGLPGQGFGLWFAVRTLVRDVDGVMGEGTPRLWLLVWASPVPRRYLFVNRLGIRGELLDEAVLAQQLRDGSLQPLSGHGNAWLRAVRSAAADRTAFH